MLDWEILIKPNQSDYLVKGKELARARIVSPLPVWARHRFYIYEVRQLDKDGMPGIGYHVRDAETVTLAEVKDGARPKVVFRNISLHQCIEFVETNLRIDMRIFNSYVQNIESSYGVNAE